MTRVATGNTITDEQIRELRAAKLISARWMRCALGLSKLGKYTDATGRVRPEKYLYRARCAEILNAREVIS